MMNNLFSIFDPSNNLNIMVGWMSMTLIFFIICPSCWLVSNKKMNFFKSIFNTLSSEFKAILGTTNKMLIIMCMTMFMFVVYNNFMGLLPYIFNSTSHMSITISLALPMWLGMNIFGWVNKMMSMFAHLVPQSTPIALMPFMVLIESISNLIRPLTLAIRLTANMIAGHLLMTLLGSQLAMSTISTIMPLMITQVMLSSLELGVSIIQAYVFAILTTLYVNEVSS